MRNRLIPLIGLGTVLSPSVALAVDNYAASAGSGLTFAAKDIGGVKYPWWIPTNSAGTELFTSGNPGFVTANSATSSNFKAQVDPLTIGNWGIMSGTVPGTAPTNTQIIGGIYNSAAPSPTTGQTLPLQMNSTGKLSISLDAGAALNSNGSTTSANSSPVVIASDQSAVAVTIGAAGTTGAAPPARAVYLGANSSGTTGGLLAGLIACNSHTYVHVTTATSTLLVQGVAGQAVYVCGMLANGQGAATVALEGTATTSLNCLAATTQLGGLMTMASGAAAGFYNPIWGGMKTGIASGLCAVSTNTGGFDLEVWTVQL